MEIEKSLNQNLLNRVESISAAASFQKLGSFSEDIDGVTKFLSVTADQTVFKRILIPFMPENLFKRNICIIGSSTP